MKKHTALYLANCYPDWGPDDYFPCELCNNELNSVHHIDPRRMGGSELKDFIENLMGACGACHDACEAGKISKQEQLLRHRRFLLQMKVEFDDYYFEVELEKLGIDLADHTEIFIGD